MAPALSSNSFLITTTPRSKLTLKNRKLTILAQRSGPSFPFRLGGKQEDESSSPTPTGENNEADKSNGFFFNLGKNIADVKSLVPVVKPSSPGLSFGNSRRKDPGTVFVAGAAGQAGIRIAQTLLRQGFTVRAAVPDLGAAQEIALLASTYKIISGEESKRLNAVGSSFDSPESIAKAMGNATKVVVTIGPDENGPTSEVTLSDALQVIQASQLAGIDHVAIIYNGAPSTSTTNVLDGISTFFNNLFSKSQPLTVTEFLEKVVEETDVKFTLIKTKLTEDFSPESSYKIVVSSEGSSATKDNNVSKSQIASLVADVFSNTAVAENKVVEVSTDPSAPQKSTYELFSVIPEDGRRKAYAEAVAKAKAEEEAIQASEKAREAAEAAKKLEEEMKMLSKQEAQAARLAKQAQQKAEAAGSSAASLAKEAQEKAKAAGSSVESLLNKAKKGFGSGVSWGSLSSQIANVVQKNIDENKPKVQIATVRGEAKARTLPAKKAVVKKSATPKSTKPKAEPTGQKTEVRNIFGGMFKQETIYMDD